MFSDRSFLGRIDLRTLPIAVKITLGLIATLVIGGLVTNVIMTQVVRNAQSDLTLSDLGTFSRTEALRVVDLIGQETTALSRLGATSLFQQNLLAHESRSSSQPSQGGIPLYEPDPGLDTQVANFKDNHPEFDSLIVVDESGHILAASPTNSTIQTATEPTWTWYQQAFNRRDGALFLSGPMDDGLTGIKGIHMAVPVYSQNSPRLAVGVVYAVWNMNNAGPLLSPGADRQVSILESDGKVLVSPDQQRGAVVDTNLLQQFTESMNTGSFAYTDATGSQVLYGHSQLGDLGLTDSAVSHLNWIVAVREPSTVVDNSTNLLISRLQVLLIVLAAIAAMIVLLSSRLLFLPLRRLTEAAVEIEEGSLDVPIPQFAKDEIGQLASILNTVVSQLVRRVRQLRSAVQISRVTALGHTTDQMLEDVASALGQQFDYPDVRIFLVDSSGQRLRLEAAFGAESERLLKIGYRIALDESSLVGRAMLLNEVMLGGGKVALREAGLITEHSELAAPLTSAGHLLGVIHILAGRLRELDQEDIEVMSLVADQLSTAIQNTLLLEQSRSQVAEIEALNRRLTRQAWEEYVGDSGALRHTLDPDQQWPQTPGKARQRTEVKAETYTDADGRLVLAAPLILRGEAVGNLAVTRPAGERWSRDEVLLLESIASRMTMIAEGIRLVEESSRRAEREQRVNEISANMLQRATSVETVLRGALNELGGALGSDRISLRIGSVPPRGDHQIGAGEAPLEESKPETQDSIGPGPNGDGGETNGGE